MHSSLVTYTKYSPYRTTQDAPRLISEIAVVGIDPSYSVQGIGEIYQGDHNKCATNYGIGYDGEIGLFVDEDETPWILKEAEETNEVLSITMALTPIAIRKFQELCLEIVERRGIDDFRLSSFKFGEGTYNRNDLDEITDGLKQLIEIRKGKKISDQDSVETVKKIGAN